MGKRKVKPDSSISDEFDFKNAVRVKGKQPTRSYAKLGTKPPFCRWHKRVAFSATAIF